MGLQANRSFISCPGRKGWKTALLVVSIVAWTSWGTTYSAWSRCRTVTVTPDATVTDTVANFPLLVCLTSANSATVFSKSRSDGFDIRFTTADGTTDLPFQRESYDPISQTAKFWVKVPAIAPNPATTTFRMYWGNGAATDAQSPSATFSTADNYRSVWHLTAPAGSNDPDATGSGHDLVPGPRSPRDTTGPVGLGTAKRFDTSYYIANKSGGTISTLNFPSGGPLTISAWINPRTLQAGRPILGKICVCNLSTWIGSYGWACNGSSPFQLRFADLEEGVGFVRCHYTMTSNTWYHLVWVRNGTGGTLTNTNVYVNGVSNGATATPNTTSLTRLDTLSFALGRDAGYHDTTVTYWNGCASEVEVYAGAWTRSRVCLTYQTQIGTTTALSYGADQILIGTLPSPVKSGRNQPEFGLIHACPNPFRGVARLTFGVPSLRDGQPADVEINVYDLRGCLVHQLVKGKYPSGRYTVAWNGAGSLKALGSSIYIVRMKAANFDRQMKLIEMK